MEDDHTREALDRLADMYLTGANLPPETAPPPARPRSAPNAGLDDQTAGPELPAPPEATPPGTTPAGQVPDGAAPLPFRTVADGAAYPQPHSTAPAAAGSTPPRSTDLVDQLSGPAPMQLPTAASPRDTLRHYAGDDAALHDTAPTAASRVEAVFLGNLPGFGGPWLTQYAHFIAAQLGPVVVLNVDREQVDLELVSTAADRHRVAELARAGNVPAFEGLIAGLKALTQPGLPAIGAWLVHLPMPLDETSIHLAPDLGRWTLICGSDQAALVGAYRWVKQLALGDDSVPPQRRVGLMVMGSDRDQARAMAGQLSQTAGNFLETPVQLIGCRKQIEPVRLEVLGSFEADQALWPQITAFLAERAEEVDAAPEPDEQTAAQPDAPARAEQPPPPIEPEPTAAPPDQAQLDLSRFLPVATALAARCPHRSDMQIGVDPQGRLHLLLAQRGTAREVAAAITDLQQVRIWARQHAQLLQLTWPAGWIDQGAEPIVHLFTAHAKAAAALVGHVEPDNTRLHLLQRITVGSAGTWFCTELN